MDGKNIFRCVGLGVALTALCVLGVSQSSGDMIPMVITEGVYAPASGSTFLIEGSFQFIAPTDAVTMGQGLDFLAVIDGLPTIQGSYPNNPPVTIASEIQMGDHSYVFSNLFDIPSWYPEYPDSYGRVLTIDGTAFFTMRHFEGGAGFGLFYESLEMDVDVLFLQNNMNERIHLVVRRVPETNMLLLFCIGLAPIIGHRVLRSCLKSCGGARS